MMSRRGGLGDELGSSLPISPQTTRQPLRPSQSFISQASSQPRSQKLTVALTVDDEDQDDELLLTDMSSMPGSSPVKRNTSKRKGKQDDATPRPARKHTLSKLEDNARLAFSTRAVVDKYRRPNASSSQTSLTGSQTSAKAYPPAVKPTKGKNLSVFSSPNRHEDDDDDNDDEADSESSSCESRESLFGPKSSPAKTPKARKVSQSSSRPGKAASKTKRVTTSSTVLSVLNALDKATAPRRALVQPPPPSEPIMEPKTVEPAPFPMARPKKQPESTVVESQPQSKLEPFPMARPKKSPERKEASRKGKGKRSQEEQSTSAFPMRSDETARARLEFQDCEPPAGSSTKAGIRIRDPSKKLKAASSQSDVKSQQNEASSSTFTKDSEPTLQKLDETETRMSRAASPDPGVPTGNDNEDENLTPFPMDVKRIQRERAKRASRNPSPNPSLASASGRQRNSPKRIATTPDSDRASKRRKSAGSDELHDLSRSFEDLCETQIPRDVDPSRLCPFCDELLPEEPSAAFRALVAAASAHARRVPRLGNPAGLKAPLTAYIGVCQQHRFESSLLPQARAARWPETLDFAALPARIVALRPALDALVADPTQSSFFHDALNAVKRMGSRAAEGVQGLYATFESIQPGYYGERGAIVLHGTLGAMYDVRALRAPPLSSASFVERVLQPEVATTLIMQDMGCARADAICTMRASARYGAIMFPDNGEDDTHRLARAAIKAQEADAASGAAAAPATSSTRTKAVVDLTGVNPAGSGAKQLHTRQTERDEDEAIVDLTGEPEPRTATTAAAKGKKARQVFELSSDGSDSPRKGPTSTNTSVKRKKAAGTSAADASGESDRARRRADRRTQKENEAPRALTSDDEPHRLARRASGHYRWTESGTRTELAASSQAVAARTSAAYATSTLARRPSAKSQDDWSKSLMDGRSEDDEDEKERASPSKATATACATTAKSADAWLLDNPSSQSQMTMQTETYSDLDLADFPDA